MILLSRLIAALAYAGAAFLFGVALGERGELGVVHQAFAYVIPFVTLVLAFVTRPGARVNVLQSRPARGARHRDPLPLRLPPDDPALSGERSGVQTVDDE